jgi:RNA polymerase sigma-70 factor, ECF subfamily
MVRGPHPSGPTRGPTGPGSVEGPVPAKHLHGRARPEATSAALAAQLRGRLTRPGEATIRAERKVRLQRALSRMDPGDREVLALRHFEHLRPAETAQVLGIKEKAAGIRSVRALRRLREILGSLGDRSMGYRP